MSTMNQDYNNRFSGIKRLYGSLRAQKINESKVTVIGLGGVGSWVVESLARSGVGQINLVDFDDVCISNTNRQLQALNNQVGKLKTKVLKERLENINPQIKIQIFDFPFGLDTQELLFVEKPNCLVDAIDHAHSKLHIAKACLEHQVPLVVVGSAGGRQDPSLIKVSDLAHTKEDNLLAILRKDLRQQCGLPRKGPLNIKAVYSLEKPLYPLGENEFTRIKPEHFKKPLDCSTGFGTVSHVTGTFGLMAAHLVLNTLIEENLKTT
jgi:tRNA threonylcarbamoyladenosine dehydratase